MNVIRFLLCVRHARTHTENALDPQIKHRKSPQIRQASRSEGFWHLLFSASCSLPGAAGRSPRLRED